MAISVPSTAAVQPTLARRYDHLFYSGMSLVILALVFAGFARTFYLSSYFHAPSLTLLRVVHGTLFSSWILLLVVQTTLVATGRVRIHRRLGAGGAVLAASMVLVGTAMAITSAREGHSVPGIEPRVFLIIPIFDMLVFAPLVAAGVYYRRQPEMHKRLMLVATISLLAAAVARLPTTLATLGPPFYFGVVDLLILAGVAYDLITRRRVHRAYVWGGLLVVLSQPLRLALSGTAAWIAIADALTRR